MAMSLSPEHALLAFGLSGVLAAAIDYSKEDGRRDFLIARVYALLQLGLGQSRVRPPQQEEQPWVPPKALAIREIESPTARPTPLSFSPESPTSGGKKRQSRRALGSAKKTASPRDLEAELALPLPPSHEPPLRVRTRLYTFKRTESADQREQRFYEAPPIPGGLRTPFPTAAATPQSPNARW
jgi:hypothetical protein